MSTRSDDHIMRQQLLQLSVQTAVLGVPIQLLGIGYIAFLGLQADQNEAAFAVAIIGLIVGITRALIGFVWRSVPAEPAIMDRITLGLELNAAGAGLVWVISTLYIYTHVSGVTASAYVTLSCGSVAIAGMSMAFAGRSFAYLIIPELGSLMLVSLQQGSMHSIPLAILIAIFGLTLFSGTRTYRAMAMTAIKRRLEADAANENLRNAMEAAQAANLAKSQFLATMSHEIRTPMNGVLGSLDLLRLSKLTSDQRKLVQTAHSSGSSLMSILNDVLDHSKIEAGKLTLASAPMSLIATASSVAALFRANAQAKGLALSVQIDPFVADRVIGDAQRVKQVLLNLVGNAIKFTDQGSVTLSIKPGSFVQDDTASVVFEVIDTGVGIAPDAAKRLFQPFHQVETGANRRRGGTGLGLAISQRIVEAMGSTITVNPNHPRGSVFAMTVTFELDTATTPAALADSWMGELDTPFVNDRATVLVVEDNAVNRLIANQMLRSLNVDVIEAESGDQALEALEHSSVGLVMMDIQMPGMDGYDTAKQIRARETRLGLHRTPIVALTANALEEDMRQAREAGMDAHLAKPFTRKQMRAVLATWLETTDAEEQTLL